MFKCEPQNLIDEVKADLDIRKPELEILRRQRAAFSRREAGRGRMAMPENPAFEYLSYLAPTLAYDNPKVLTKTRRPGSQRQVAIAMMAGLNRWVVDSDYQTHLMRMAYDFAFYHGASITSHLWKDGEYPDKDTGRPTRGSIAWPVVDRVSPHRFAVDPLCAHWSEARWMGHATFWDKEDIKDRAKDEKSGWNAKAIEALCTTGEGSSRGRPERAEGRVPERDEIVCWELWVPEYTEDKWAGPDEGVHGGMFTVALDQATGAITDWLRKPRPFYGPRWGPYSVFGAYVDPDCPMPLGPLGIVYQQIDDLNDHARSIARSCTTYKRLILVDAGSKKLANVLKSTPDSFVVPVEGLKKDDVIQVEVGGVTDQQLSQYSIVKTRLDRMLAMQDAQRGTVTGRGTATENSIADEASSKRMAHLKRQFTKASIRELRTVGWGMYHNDRVIFPVGGEASQEMGGGDAFFFGGDTKDGSGVTYDDLELDIEPYSAEYTSEALLQTRTMQGAQFVIETAPMIPQTPWLDWKDLYQQVGNAINIPNLSDAVNVEMAMKMAGGQSPFPGGQPILARQLGRADRSRGGAGGRPLNVAPMPQLPAGPGGGMAPGPQQTAASKPQGALSMRSA